MPTEQVTAPRVGKAEAHGTCGELMQGFLRDGTSFHVTCPIAARSRASVRLEVGDGVNVRVEPPSRVKARRALHRAASTLGLQNMAIDATIESELPVAKGMGSSTADIVAAVRALACAAGTHVDAQLLASIAAGVERSDGTMFDGVVAFDHEAGRLLRCWAWTPRFTIATFVPSASLDTPAVRDRRDDEARADRHEILLESLDRAMRSRDIDAVAALSTASAELNQRRVSNPLWPIMQSGARTHTALGVCVGHSGTVAGLLFAPDHDGERRARRAIEQMLPLAPRGTRAWVTHSR